MAAKEGNRGDKRDKADSESDIIEKEKEDGAPRYGIMIIMKIKGRG